MQGPEKEWKKQQKKGGITHKGEPLKLTCHYFEPELEGEYAIFGNEVDSVCSDEGEGEGRKHGGMSDEEKELFKNQSDDDEEDDPGIGLKSVSSVAALAALIEEADRQADREKERGASREKADREEEPDQDQDDEADMFLEDCIVVYLHTNTANSMQAKEILPLCR